eukprot:TRINITY_DN27809_c0_g1_i1.p1 TRINITY_DN27809_c0_g1~~TRINITY_DN27809_c0_g1_i1.p1  ORF type:complete len:359 (-),score=61.38 TRINITY_DN27809_c0_g1_i1:200-1117(-)
MGENHSFWQEHESLERRKRKKLSKRTHALLALGLAVELRASVEQYMMEAATQGRAAGDDHDVAELPTQHVNTARARRPPPPARPWMGDTDVVQLPALQVQRALVEQEATSSHMNPSGSASSASAPLPNQPDAQHYVASRDEACDPCSESEEEEDDMVLGHASTYDSTFDETDPVVQRSKATACEASAACARMPDENGFDIEEMQAAQARDAGRPSQEDAGNPELVPDGRSSSSRGNVFRRHLQNHENADQPQFAVDVQPEQGLRLRPEPPRAQDDADAFAPPPPLNAYRRPLRQYMLPAEAAMIE